MTIVAQKSACYSLEFYFIITNFDKLRKKAHLSRRLLTVDLVVRRFGGHENPHKFRQLGLEGWVGLESEKDKRPGIGK